MTEESRDTPGVIAPPPLIFALIWLAAWLVHLKVPVHLLPAGWTRPLGGAIAILGVALAIWGRTAMSRVGTDPNPYKPSTAIAQGGPFRFTRNPLYLSMTIFYVGLTLLANAVWPLIVLPVVLVLVQRGVIEREERYLERRFGQAYRDYRARVRRWL